MKKYQQLLLLILSIISIVSLLFYRHEYNKLRYVLEVLNFFGAPGASTASPCEDNSNNHSLKLQEPLPSWQRISNTIFIYSAFWEIGTKNLVQAIVLGSLNENVKFGCYLWFDEYNDPVKGRFSFSALPSPMSRKKKHTKGFIFYCDPGEEYSAPFGVTFHNTNNEDERVFTPVLNMTPQGNVAADTTAICVLPLNNPRTHKSTFLEFLAFHQVVGIHNFVVYGNRYLHSILKELNNKAHGFNVDVLQWNYPYIDDWEVVKTIVEQDCVLRTKLLYENVLVLNWNQLFVPKIHSNALSLIHDLNQSKKASKLQFNTFLFCSEYKDDPKSDISLPLPLRKTRYTLPKLDYQVSMFHPSFKLEDSTPIKVSKDIVTIHWYTECGDIDLKVPEKNKNLKFDYGFLKFNSQFLRSKLFKLPNVHHV